MSRTSPDVPGTWEFGDPGKPIARPYDERERRIAAANGFHAERFSLGQATIFVDREPAGIDGAMLWHLSISRPNRHPSWDDLKAARYRLLPLDLTFGVLLPPPDEYVNVAAQDHVFHVWEVEDARAPS